MEDDITADVTPRDNPDDLALADALYGRLMTGDVQVVHNKVTPKTKANRHTEQINRVAMAQSGKDYRWGEAAGTFIRCEGCSAELGVNLRTPDGKLIVGKVYNAQASPAHHEHIFEGIVKGDTVVVTSRPERAASPSPPRAILDAPPPEEKKTKKKPKKKKKAEDNGDEDSE